VVLRQGSVTFAVRHFDAPIRFRCSPQRERNIFLIGHPTINVNFHSQAMPHVALGLP
jgi:hypothetical protein